MKLFVSLTIFIFLLGSTLFSGELNTLEKEINNLYNEVSPSIVSIHYGSMDKPNSIGTGVVIDKKADIVTIKRFLNDEKNIWVEISNGTKLDAKLIGKDSETGIIVLRVNQPLKPVKFCEIDSLQPGDLLFIVGNSFGLKNGISVSIFSGKRNDEFLQLGNAVQPGNSGAGVFNSKGELAGIVSFALRNSFDIPKLFSEQFHLEVFPPAEAHIATIGPGVVMSQKKMNEIVKEIIRTGRVERGWLGIFLTERKGKIVVKDVVDKSPAIKAGIKKGDIIVTFNKKEAGDLNNFIETVKATKPGTKVQIKVKRGKRTLSLKVIIGKRPQDEKLYRMKEILPSINIFPDKQEIEKLKQEIEKLKEELEKAKNQLKENKKTTL